MAGAVYKNENREIANAQLCHPIIGINILYYKYQNILYKLLNIIINIILLITQERNSHCSLRSNNLIFGTILK